MSRNKQYDTALERVTEDLHRSSVLFGFGKQQAYGQIYEEARAITRKMQETYERKDNDYSQNGKPMGNFRSCEAMGLSAWKGILVRMNDKRQRIGSFIAHKEYKVEDEKVDDTLVDLANYALLAMVLFKEIYPKRYDIHERFHNIAVRAIHCRILYSHQANPTVDRWDDRAWQMLNDEFECVFKFARSPLTMLKEIFSYFFRR